MLPESCIEVKYVQLPRLPCENHNWEKAEDDELDVVAAVEDAVG